MKSKKVFELALVVFFLIFSWWLMDKSFGYDATTHQFRIARHQLGDFGLHLSLIRSFSWGDNFPPELPFFPGRPLPYHYGFDLLVGLLARIGTPIDIAFNGISSLAFAGLLYAIYKFSQIMFGKNILVGLLSVALFIFHSNLTFLDFIKNKSLSWITLRELWLLPDYINKGPFDGSTISLFSTLNVFLNQRHLIVALVISLGVLIYLLPRLFKNKIIPIKSLVVIGSFLGFVSWVHTLVFFSDLMVIGILLFLFGRVRWIWAVFVPATLIAMPRLATIILFRDPSRAFDLFNPGFLAPRPLTIAGLVSYWWQNLGVALIVLPVAVRFAPKNAQKVFWAVLPLFLLANIAQLSYRIDHNHTLINYFIIIANCYLAFAMVKLLQKTILTKIIAVVLMLLLTVSGIIDFMAIKNDFQYTFEDAPANRFMEWIQRGTDPHAIFLSREDILDPITLSGRSNYFGATYYGEVMGYPISQRRSNAVKFFEARDASIFQEMKQERIDYVVIPLNPSSNFRYEVQRELFASNLEEVYSDAYVEVYKL